MPWCSFCKPFQVLEFNWFLGLLSSVRWLWPQFDYYSLILRSLSETAVNGLSFFISHAKTCQQLVGIACRQSHSCHLGILWWWMKQDRKDWTDFHHVVPTKTRTLNYSNWTRNPKVCQWLGGHVGGMVNLCFMSTMSAILVEVGGKGLPSKCKQDFISRALNAPWLYFL